MSILGFSELYIGTEVTFATPSLQKWVIEEKLTEDVQQMTKWELNGGDGPPFAVFKCLCHSVADSDEKAFMRFYFQVPIEGNEYERPEVRQRQAASRKHLELDVLKDLQLRQCPMVPSLLAYKQGKQGNDSPVPDGYITHIVWDKVPGKSLSQDKVWDPTSGPLREAVREKFRVVWEELRRYGWEPGMPGLENIIYDEATQTMHIAGFRESASLDPEEKFTDMTFVGWGLAIPPRKAGWDKDSTSYAYGRPQRLKHVLGQPILYMADLQCGFGFVSIYDETIFLRQVQLASGQWIVEYLPVIYSTDAYKPSGSQGYGSGLSVSMRQCMFYVAMLASAQGPVNNQTPVAQWVVKV